MSLNVHTLMLKFCYVQNIKLKYKCYLSNPLSEIKSILFVMSSYFLKSIKCLVTTTRLLDMDVILSSTFI